MLSSSQRFSAAETFCLLKWASAKDHPPKLTETFASNLCKHDLNNSHHISLFSTGLHFLKKVFDNTEVAFYKNR